jgi:hypothetical protein
MEDWGAARDAMRSRMRELKMSTAKLARETGLSETTIRYLGRSQGGHYKSALVAISAVLRWRHDYLLNVLHGESHKNVIVKPGLEILLRNIVQSEIAPLKDEVAALKDTVRTSREARS